MKQVYILFTAKFPEVKPNGLYVSLDAAIEQGEEDVKAGVAKDWLIVGPLNVAASSDHFNTSLNPRRN